MSKSSKKGGRTASLVGILFLVTMLCILPVLLLNSKANKVNDCYQESSKLKRHTKLKVDGKLVLKNEGQKIVLQVDNIKEDYSGCGQGKPGVIITVLNGANQIGEGWEIIGIPERLTKFISIVIKDP